MGLGRVSAQPLGPHQRVRLHARNAQHHINRHTGQNIWIGRAGIRQSGNCPPIYVCHRYITPLSFHHSSCGHITEAPHPLLQKCEARTTCCVWPDLVAICSCLHNAGLRTHHACTPYTTLPRNECISPRVWHAVQSIKACGLIKPPVVAFPASQVRQLGILALILSCLHAIRCPGSVFLSCQTR